MERKHDQALIEALETIAAGNTDPDQMVKIARAALAKTAAHEQQDKPMRWPSDFPGKHDKAPSTPA